MLISASRLGHRCALVVSCASLAISQIGFAATAPTEPAYTVLSVSKSLLDPNNANAPYLVRTSPVIADCAYGFVVIKDDSAAAALLQSANAARDTRNKVNLTLVRDANNYCLVNAIAVAPTTAPSGSPQPVSGGINTAEGFSGYNNRFATAHKSAYRDFSQGKFDESIDPVSGRLILSYNDVVLPGPNGLDIKVVRSYHSPDPTQTVADLSESFEPKFNGFGWNVYVNNGGVRGLHINSSCVPRETLNDPGGYFFSIENMPSWITAEGRAIPMMPVSNNPGNPLETTGYWVTPNGIRIACQFEQNGLLPVAIYPDGTRVELGFTSSVTEQTIPGTENGRRNNYLPTKITDRWGNFIQFEYLTSYGQQPYGLGSLISASNGGAVPITRIFTNDTREILFRYGSDLPGWTSAQALPLADFALKQIDYGSYSVKYSYNRIANGSGGIISSTSGKYFLSSVERPDTKVWAYGNNLTGHTAATFQNPNLGQYLLSSITFPQGGVTNYTWGYSTRTTPPLPGRTQRPWSNQVRLKTTSDSGTWRYVYTDSVRNPNDTADDIPDPVTNLNIAYPVVPDPGNPPLPAFEGSRVTGPTGIEVFYHAPRFFQLTNISGENPGAIGGPIETLGLIRRHSVYPLGSNFRNNANPPMPVESTAYTHQATYPSFIELRQGFPDAYSIPLPPQATASTSFHSRVLSKTTTRGPRNATLSYTHTNGAFSQLCGEAQGATQQGQRTRRTSITFGAYCQVVNEVLEEGDGLGSFTRKKRTQRTPTANTLNIERETWYGPTDTEPIVVNRYTYHPTGDVASKTDAVNNVTRFNDYKLGTPREELHPTVRGGDANTESAGTRIRITRVVDNLGRITSETDGEGRTIEFTYNGEHKPLTIILPRVTTARTITFTYNNMNDTIVQGSRSEQVNYDGFGRVSSYFNGLFTTNYSHDAAGRRFFVSYPGKTQGQTVTFDELNRPTSFTEPNPTGTGQALTQMVYADNEPSMTATNARGATFKTTYESFADPSDAWIKTQFLPDNVGSIVYSRNVFGQPETIAYTNPLDASANLTRSIIYDNTNQYFLKEHVHPELGRKIYVRDANNNVERSSVQLGTSNTGDTVYTYDGQNRLLTVTPPIENEALEIVQTWYRSGKLKTIAAGGVVRANFFDANDNLTSETVTIDGRARSLAYAYDALDHLETTTYPSGDTATFAPDVLGRPTQALPFVNSMSHHPSGLVASMTYANGVTQSFGEQTARPLPNSLGVTKNAANLLSLGFAYDSAANLLTLTDATNLGYARNNTFDFFDRILTSNSPSNASNNEGFTYKGIGDFNTKSGATFNYDSSTRRLSSISATNSLYNRSYSYDLYGNATSDGRFNYDYDAYSNLRRSKQLNDTTIAEYTYDGFNHLAKKFSVNPPNGNANLATVHYLYSQGGKLFGEYPSSSTGVGKEYIYASGKMVGQSVRGGATNNPISVNGTGPLNSTWYIGKPQDTTTGLVYFGQRWFDPAVARFLGFDPAEVDEGNPHSFNRYAYGNNNPYKYLDPDGRAVFLALIPLAPEAIVGLAAAGSAVAGTVAVVGARLAPFAQRALAAAMNATTTLSHHPATPIALETAAALATGTQVGSSAVLNAPATSAISMSKAVDMAVAHVGSSAQVTVSGSGAFQFISTFVNDAKQTITKIARFDVNPKSPHVQKLGPHLNLETQVNGKTIKVGPQADPHIPIDKGSIRPGDIPE